MRAVAVAIRVPGGERRRRAGLVLRLLLDAESLQGRQHLQHDAKVGALLKVKDGAGKARAGRTGALQASPKLPHALELLRAKRPMLRIQDLDCDKRCAPAGRRRSAVAVGVGGADYLREI